MEYAKKTSTRKKFLLWSAALISSVTFFKFSTGSKKSSGTNDEGNNNTVKMLTQDGKLVEVDAEKLFCGKRKKISDEQLKNWVNKKQSKTSD